MRAPIGIRRAAALAVLAGLGFAGCRSSAGDEVGAGGPDAAATEAPELAHERALAAHEAADAEHRRLLAEHERALAEHERALAAGSAETPQATTPPEPEEPRQHGVSIRYWFVGEPLDRLLLLVPGQTPNVSEVLEVLDLESDAEHKVGEMQYTFLTRVDGWLEVPESGRWGLRIVADDGCRMRLDGEVVLEHDGPHSLGPIDAEVDLEAGVHELEIEHFQGYGGWGLSLQWRPPGAAAFEVVPHESLWCPKGEVRVTSPGPKRALRPLERGVPGDGLPLVAVHPSYDLATVRPEGFDPKVGGIAWLPDGRMLVATWDPVGAVYVLAGVESGDAAKVVATRFAAGLAEPLGIATIGERVFVLQKQELTELVDRDGDGVADVYRSVCSAWDVSPNFHEFAFGLVAKDGWLYFNLAIAIDPGGRSTRPQVPGRGSVLRVHADGGRHEVVAHGLRTPNGIGLGPGGEIFLTDNQGDWLPSSKLLRLEPGAFYGSRAVLLDAAAELPVTPPVLWLPQNEIGNSPGSCALIPPGHGPYSGQLCHGDVTQGGVQRDFLEVVDGVWQGCVFRWTQGLEAGVNRVSFGPDGALYAGGIGSTGNWGQEGKRKSGLQRLAYNGRPTFEMLAVRALGNGFEVELTEPLAPDTGWEPENWRVEQWRYVPTEQYGGPKVGLEVLEPRSASVSDDRRRVFLELDGLEEDRVVHLRIVGPLVSESGLRPWTTEAWYTLNRIPRDRRGEARPAPPKPPQNVLTATERDHGWELLFDGRSLAGWHHFKQPGEPIRGWEVLDGALVRTGAGGDLVSAAEYRDFELSLEWKISERGNSGIFYRVADAHDAVWESGPEMQVLDNAGHADGRNPLTSAGSCYAIHAPKWDPTRPVGLWNEARVLVRENHVEHWLNGSKVVEYELLSPEWEELVRASKFGAMPAYGRAREGRIALQDHGDRVEYRNVKVRELGADASGGR